MGIWLSRLKNQKVVDNHASEPRQLSSEEVGESFLGFIAPLRAPLKGNEGLWVTAESVNDPIGSLDVSDRYCWPYTVAMNSAEIDQFVHRVERFTNFGVSLERAERLSDALVTRDREADDRRICLECAYLIGVKQYRCINWGRAHLASHALPSDLTQMLQRCFGFVPVL